MPTEKLFSTVHAIIIGLIVVVIAAVIVISALAAMGMFESSQQNFNAQIAAPAVSCAGNTLSVTITNVSIETVPQDIGIMPILTYRDVACYDAANLIPAKSGKGSISNMKCDLLMGDQMPTSGQRVWLTLTLWKWSPGGCLSRAITSGNTKYSTLVGACVADFIMSKTVESANAC